jgi:hypothetical protein
MPDYQQLRRERETIDTAARALRSTAIADGYAGLQHKAVAFGFALILDELSRHWAQMSDEVRRAALDCYTTLAADLVGNDPDTPRGAAVDRWPVGASRSSTT